MYKKFLVNFLRKTFKFHGTDWEIYHLLIIVIIFYGITFSILIFDLSTIDTKHTKSMEVKLQLLDKKWLKEGILWLNTIVLVCLFTIYRNGILFTKEFKIRQEKDGKS